MNLLANNFFSVKLAETESVITSIKFKNLVVIALVNNYSSYGVILLLLLLLFSSYTSFCGGFYPTITPRIQWSVCPGSFCLLVIKLLLFRSAGYLQFGLYGYSISVFLLLLNLITSSIAHFFWTRCSLLYFLLFFSYCFQSVYFCCA